MARRRRKGLQNICVLLRQSYNGSYVFVLLLEIFNKQQKNSAQPFGFCRVFKLYCTLIIGIVTQHQYARNSVYKKQRAHFEGYACGAAEFYVVPVFHRHGYRPTQWNQHPTRSDASKQHKYFCNGFENGIVSLFLFFLCVGYFATAFHADYRFVVDFCAAMTAIFHNLSPLVYDMMRLDFLVLLILII